MFGRDHTCHKESNTLVQMKVFPDLEALQNLLQMTMTQIQYAATKRNQSFKPMKLHDFKVGDLVLVSNHMSQAFQEKYQDSY